MVVTTHIFAVLSALITAAHYLRAENFGLCAAVASLPLLLLLRHAWVRPVLTLLLCAGALEWIGTAVEIAEARIALGQPWLRMAVILGAVTALSIFAAIGLNLKCLDHRFAVHQENRNLSVTAFFITAILLSIVQLKVAKPMLLPERFFSGGGWIAILALSVYAAIIAQKMASPANSATWRKRIWLIFGVVFFAQGAIGMLGVDRLLMSGTPHVPVPAVIVAGPIFRGEGFFMPILFGVTMILAGPAWCSHLCYFGGFDALAARGRQRPESWKRWMTPVRISILILVVLAAFTARSIGLSPRSAAMIALGFGAMGVLVMFFVSRRLRMMAHCTVYCPVGLIATIAGRISPFRVQFSTGCDGCGACRKSCRYGALEAKHIENRSVGFNCTLCGDCIGTCRSSRLEYRFGPWRGPRVRSVFLALIVALHAVTLGVARM